MSVSTIPVIRYYNGKILSTETNMKYVENKVVIMHLDELIDCTFELLDDMIYSRIDIDKQMFKLVINCKYPLQSGNRFQPYPISSTPIFALDTSMPPYLPITRYFHTPPYLPIVNRKYNWK